MMIQRDGDNLVITLAPMEVGVFPKIAESVAYGLMFGVGVSPFDQSTIDTLLSSPYRVYTDDEFLDAVISQHLEHPGDDVVAMREALAPQIAKAREALVAEGIIG